MENNKVTNSSDLFEDRGKMGEKDLQEKIIRLQTELIDLKEKYQGFFNLTHDAMTVVDIDGKYLDVNQKATELFGYPQEELLGRSVYDIILPEEKEKAEEKHQALLKGEKLPIYERILKRKDGTEITVLISAKLLRDETGKPKYFLNAISDISERKKFEESIMKQAGVILEGKKEIEQSEEEKLRILNSMEEHVIYYEEGMEIKWANTAAAKSLNKKQEEIIGEKCYTLWAKRDAICEGCPVTAARKTLQPQTKEMNTPDGRIWLVRGLPIIEEGKLKAVVEITQEITEKKKAQEAIEKLNIELERRVRERTAQLKLTNEELKTFSYSVSHDLRAPIRRISSFTELLSRHLEKKAGEDEKASNYIQAIFQSVTEMENYIDGMLVLSRVTQAELKKQEIELKDLVEDIIQKNRNEYSKKHIIWQVDENLPKIYGDKTLLQLALTNVLLNSIKFTQKEQEPIIVVGYDQSQSDEYHTVFYVRDNGVGFDMKYLSKLFAAFQRLHHEREYQGTGIGLATVKRIINRHNGNVWAESEEQKGTTIYFKLPKKVIN